MNDTHVVVKGTVIAEGVNAINRRNKELFLQNNATNRSYILKTSNTFIENAKDLDIVTPLCNILNYSANCSMIVGSFCNYYREEIDNDMDENGDNYMPINEKITSQRQLKLTVSFFIVIRCSR